MPTPWSIYRGIYKLAPGTMLECSDGGKVCDAAGACVACNVDTDCEDAAGDCLVPVCDKNACGSTNEPKVRRLTGATVKAAGETTVVVQPPQVPAGGAGNVVDPNDLKPTTKIALALADRKRK